MPRSYPTEDCAYCKRNTRCRNCGECGPCIVQEKIEVERIARADLMRNVLGILDNTDHIPPRVRRAVAALTKSAAARGGSDGGR